MGLDAVELVMAIEEEFEIEIPDDSATKMRTVGDLVDFVAANATQPISSESGRPEWIDEHFDRVIGRKVSNLPAATRVIDVLGGGRKAQQWAKLAGVLPKVVRPLWARLCIPIGLLLVCGLTFGPIGVVSGGRMEWVFWISLHAVLPYSLLALLSLRAAKIPDVDLTIGKLLRHGQADTRREFIGERVKRIVADQLGVPLAIVKDESSFIEDLGMQ